MTFVAALFALVLHIGSSGVPVPEDRSDRDSTDTVVWEVRTACPYSCRRCGGASDGTYFYILGGWDGVNTRAYNYRYDPGSNSWSQRQNMTTAVSNAGVCYSLQYNAIFVFGGLVQSGDSVTLVQRYDVTTNSWSSNATLPYQDYGIAAAALGEYVYVLFGSGHPGRFWRYHPQTNSWVELAQCTGATSHAALCVRSGLIYASGGWTQNSMFKCYNPSTNVWQTLPSLPQARHGHGMDTLGTRIYVYGGGQTWGATQNCWSYNPADSTWSYEGNMLQPHIGGAFAAVVTGGIPRLHAACGHYATDRHERGNPAPPDVGVVAVAAPKGTIDTLQAIAPACSVANFGPVSVSFRVRCRVGTFYNDTTTISDIAPGARAYALFPACAHWPRGRHVVTCSTELAGDVNPGNDRMTDSVTVNVHDVGAQAIVAPSGSIDSGVAVTPACS
ncbi:MAG: kelch repeat-containing protein, partial [candidate division WOR-3 bacterium]